MDDRKFDVKQLCDILPAEVYKYADVSSLGLSMEEALIRERRYGKNKIPRASAMNPLKQFIKQFTHVMALLLWAAGILALVAGMPQLAVATWSVIIINALFSFFQEFKADKTLSNLANMLPIKVKVVRAGESIVLPAEDITIGDIIILDAGDCVPADARIIQSEGLTLDNSLLTGESMPVDRNEFAFDLGDTSIIESTNLVFAGTTVTVGKAQAIVFAVGSQTEIGNLSKLTQTIIRGQSNLELQVQKIVRFITKVALVLGLLAFTLAVFGMGLDYKVGFVFALGIIVANIPEGLLPTVSLSMAVGVQRMAKQNALIRRLTAVETLSAVSVICTDKTGTITENQLMVKKIWAPEALAEFEGVGFEKKGQVEIKNKDQADLLETILTAATICSETNIVENKLNPLVWDVIGSSTEAALLVAADKFGVNIEEERRRFERIKTIPFSSATKSMSVLVRNLQHPKFKEGSNLIFTKGAPDEVVQTCHYIYKKGILTEIKEEIREEISRENDKLAGEGFRVLGISYQESEADDFLPDKKNIFLGLVAMYDPPRPEVYDAFKQCSRAGIKITIITGDYGITALAIAQQLGLAIDTQHIITGHDLDEMSDEGLESILRGYQLLIFSRTTPIHKLRIVEAYKRIGETVAVTGDGVNDTLALKSSHIGIAMGIGGTDVARQAADMVLLDNNFATIVKAVEEGRSIYSNIRKFLTYILTSNIPEFTPFVAMVAGRIPPALNVLQILAIDMGTDIVPALALGAEKPEKGVLDNPPSKFKENILNRSLFLRAYAFLGLIEGILSITVFLYVWVRAGYSLQDIQGLTNAILNHTASQEVIRFYQYATTMAFASIIACQIGNVFICRSEKQSFWTMFSSKNNLIYWGLGVELLVTSAIIFLPVLAGVFQTQPITWNDLIILALCPVIMILLEEIRKWIARNLTKISDCSTTVVTSAK